VSGGDDTLEGHRYAAGSPEHVLDAATPFVWPEGRTVAVVPTITWETWPDDLGTPASHQITNRPPVPASAVHPVDTWAIRDHLYAEEVGMRRLLDAMDALDVKATVFANGLTIAQHPDLAREVRDRGHELASEGWIHEYSIELDEAAERRSITRTVETFESVLGQRPRGYISPGHRATPHTDAIVAELGYDYEASFDLWDRPHVMDVGGRRLVGMPYGLVDYQIYRYDGRAPRELAAMLDDEIATLREEGAAGHAGMVGYVFHPFLARGYRTRPFVEVLRRARDHDDVWFATRAEIADRALQQLDAADGGTA
jgi:peptidoglycan/xylan/chitin deacetylase (PgdA/CDA1 family)